MKMLGKLIKEAHMVGWGKVLVLSYLLLCKNLVRRDRHSISLVKNP